MKQFVKEFILRGLMAAGFGPIILAIVYAVLGKTGAVTSFSPQEVCRGILTITFLAFFVAGMTSIYQIEQLPLASAIAIHGIGLYAAYLLIYLVNGWLKDQLASILVFSAVFAANYALIWLAIYLITRHKAKKINKLLRSDP